MICHRQTRTMHRVQCGTRALVSSCDDCVSTRARRGQGDGLARQPEDRFPSRAMVTVPRQPAGFRWPGRSPCARLALWGKGDRGEAILRGMVFYAAAARRRERSRKRASRHHRNQGVFCVSEPPDFRICGQVAALLHALATSVPACRRYQTFAPALARSLSSRPKRRRLTGHPVFE